MCVTHTHTHAHTQGSGMERTLRLRRPNEAIGGSSPTNRLQQQQHTDRDQQQQQLQPPRRSCPPLPPQAPHLTPPQSLIPTRKPMRAPTAGGQRRAIRPVQNSSSSNSSSNSRTSSSKTSSRTRTSSTAAGVCARAWFPPALWMWWTR